MKNSELIFRDARRLTFRRRLSSWLTPNRVLRRAPLRRTSPRLRRDIPSTTIPALMSWCSSIPAHPARPLKSACCTPALGGMFFRLPKMKDSRSRGRYVHPRFWVRSGAHEQQIEASSPDEITADRLREEVHPPQDQGPARGFARPRRPGR